MRPKGFDVRVPDAEVADLQRRLAQTRFIDPPPDGGWDSGMPVGYLRELVRHWRLRFDWRQVEDRINSFENLLLEVKGLEVHCARARGKGPNPMPIVLVHGWPSSFVEYLDVADQLADPAAHGGDSRDSFDVVIVSIPGFGYSQPPQTLDWASPEDDGETVADVMTALGYKRFVVHTHDIGASAMRIVLVEQPDRIIGYHTTEPGIPGPHPRPDEESVSDEERERLSYGQRWHAEEGGYFALLGTRPQTIGHALNDSPAGLAAWIVEKWWSWTVPPGSNGKLDDFFTFDQLLANVALYWHTQTINSANWPYFRKLERGRTPGERSSVPVGVALTTQPIDRVPRAWAERFFSDIRAWVELGKGGHFVAMEEPSLLATSIRDFVRPLRAREGPH